MESKSGSGRQLRAKPPKHYDDEEEIEDEIEGKRTFSVEEKLKSDRFTEDFVEYMDGTDFGLKYFQKNGFHNPICFKNKDGLGIRIPGQEFNVNDVRQFVGSRRMVDVMDVNTQKGIEMSMQQWTRYFEQKEREKLYNVISLEFSHTRLENHVVQPEVVRQIDWVDTAWPPHLKDKQTESTNAIADMKYPKVQKYCLMSVKGCYTDFHVDFGGTSVWYHILHGGKVFWLIPPTPENLELYEKWVLSGKQGDLFFGDMVKKCARVRLEEGYTFFIPTGWIHAVYTPKDSLVFGGNFLHSFSIPAQFSVWDIEDRTHVPMKFRYPFYEEIHWYLLDQYLNCLTGKSYLNKEILDRDDEDPQEATQLKVISESKVTENVRVCAKEGRTTPVKKEQEDLEDTLGTRKQQNGHHVNGDKGEESKVNGGPRVGTRTRRSRVRGMEDEEEDSKSKDSLPEERSQSPKPAKFEKKPLSQSDKTKDNQAENEAEQKEPENGKTEHAGSEKAAGSGEDRPYVHLTKYELQGLEYLVDRLEKQPANKRNVPDALTDPDGLLKDVKTLLEEHKPDKEEESITGKPSIYWPQAENRIKPVKKKTYGASGSASKPKMKSATGNISRRRTRCRQCEACTRGDCGECHFCKDMKKYGGPGRMKQSCIRRKCLRPALPNNASCKVCGTDDRDDDSDTSLMECVICGEIVHPDCLQCEGEGVVNEDLPNSWECPKCSLEGKTEKMMCRVMKRPHAAEGRTADGDSPTGKKRKESSTSSEVSDDSPKKGSTADESKHPGKRARSNESLRSENNRSLKKKRHHSESPRPGTSDLDKDKHGGKKAFGKKLSGAVNGHSQPITLVKRGPPNLRRSPRGRKARPPSPARPLKLEQRVIRPRPISPPNDSMKLNDGTNHPLPRKLWMLIFQNLANKELCSCMAVCKTWNRWCTYHRLNQPSNRSPQCLATCKTWNRWGNDHRLWKVIDLSYARTLNPSVLEGVVRRQPMTLDLSWTNVPRRHLSWLIQRLPTLKHLVLSGCAWSGVSALCTSTCPLLRSLNLCWAEGIKDSTMKDLLSPPADRPGAPDNRSRLRMMTDLRLAGCDVAEGTIQLLVKHMPHLSHLDLSYCTKISDSCMELLTAEGSPIRESLTDINLTGCRKLTDDSLKLLSHCPNLLKVDVRSCAQVTPEACQQFACGRDEPMAIKEDKLIMLAP
ncbi:lysine-specific demethylase 2A-like isoform X1 [Branchiostoma floridae x Branchiostoma belcheri]